jgi:hypothetical protein
VENENQIIVLDDELAVTRCNSYGDCFGVFSDEEEGEE